MLSVHSAVVRLKILPHHDADGDEEEGGRRDGRRQEGGEVGGKCSALTANVSHTMM